MSLYDGTILLVTRTTTCVFGDSSAVNERAGSGGGLTGHARDILSTDPPNQSASMYLTEFRHLMGLVRYIPALDTVGMLQLDPWYLVSSTSVPPMVLILCRQFDNST